MDKVVDALLFVAAAACALALFALGRRYVVTRANGRRAQKFLLYTSMVLVFLGGVTGVFRLGGGLLCAQEARRDTGLARDDRWRRVTALVRDALTFLRGGSRTDATAADDLQTRLRKRLSDVDALEKAGRIPKPVRLYMRRILKDLAWRVEKAGRGGKCGRKELVERFVFQLRMHRDVACFLAGVDLVDDDGRPEELKKFFGGLAVRLVDRAVAEQMRSCVQAAFDMVRGVPLKERLKHGGLDRDEYKKLLTGLSDAVYGFVAKVPAPPARPRPPSPPRAQPEYGVRPIRRPVRGPVAPPGRPSPSVFSISGRLKVRRPGGVWRPVAPGATLTRASVLENESAKKVEMSFSGGLVATVAPKALVTGWELGAEVPDDVKDKVDRLVKDLGGGDASRRKAMEELREMGRVAWPALEKAAVDGDARRAAAAGTLLVELKKRCGADGGSVTVDDLSLIVAPRGGGEDMRPVPLYGVRPRYGVRPLR